jgi:hypothetical protein
MVMMLAGEDHPLTTVRPRLRRLGADLSKVHLAEGVRCDGGVKHIRLDADRIEIRAFIKEHGVRLVIADPFPMFLETTPLSYEPAIRDFFASYRFLSEATGCAFLFVRHLAKQAQRTELQQGSGSLAIMAAARVGLALRQGKRPDERLLVTLKNNLMEAPPPLRLRFADGQFTPLGPEPEEPAETAAAGGAPRR